jgi:23S rRNA (adenine2503-C2)-methyltransferase
MIVSNQQARPELRSLDEAELLDFCKSRNQPAFRAAQVMDWIYQKRVEDIAHMRNLPKDFRVELEKTYSSLSLEVVRTQGSKDTTRKFLLKLPDQQLVETVLIPASEGLYGDRSDRHTLCVSSQVGCAYGCRFCASGLDGFRRNLSAGEIVSQLMAVEKATGVHVNNIVFMGMGEPLANYAHVLKAIRILNAPWGVGIGARKITVSTSGIAPKIEELSLEPLQIRLAISLHGARDVIRDKIMPINKKFPLSKLVAACDTYQKNKGRLITFEYILLDGINNHPEEIPQLARLAKKVHAKVNLIPFNEVAETGFKRPSDEDCRKFAEGLAGQGVTTTLRTEKGHDIDAACGQLRLKEMRAAD